MKTRVCAKCQGLSLNMSKTVDAFLGSFSPNRVPQEQEAVQSEADSLIAGRCLIQ